MKRGLYRRLAQSGMKKNREIYLPFLLAITGMVAIFILMVSLMDHLQIASGLRGRRTLLQVLEMGLWVVAFFAVLFLLYTNQFLMKRRKREFALYHMLGMEKKHLLRVLGWEIGLLGGAGFLFGIFFGSVFYKLSAQLLSRFAHVDPTLLGGFLPSVSSLWKALLLFSVLNLVIFLLSSRQIYFLSPIQLMQEARAGEKKVRANGLIALLSAGCLGIGYYLALTARADITLLPRFFYAILWVMAGTYGGFVSLSVKLLDLAQRNPHLYYKKKNFTVISGLRYRMRMNAVGLANICILSSAVLLLLSSVVALALGVQKKAQTAYPTDVMLEEASLPDVTPRQPSLREAVDAYRKEAGWDTPLEAYRYFPRLGKVQEGQLKVGEERATQEKDLPATVFFFRKEDCPQQASEDQPVIYKSSTTSGETPTQWKLGDRTLSMVEGTGDFLPKTRLEALGFGDMYFVILPDEALYRETLQDSRNDQFVAMEHQYVGFDWPYQGEAEQEAFQALSERLHTRDTSLSLEQQDRVLENYFLRTTSVATLYEFYGGLFFVGSLLSLAFILATSLTIYYKQLSEGYEDRRRYDVMQNVGMSRSEVRQSIRAQVRAVFFLPVLTAGIHFCVAFPLLRDFLTQLGMGNQSEKILAAALAYLCFFLFYLLIFRWTSRTYERLVSRPSREARSV